MGHVQPCRYLHQGDAIHQRPDQDLLVRSAERFNFTLHQALALGQFQLLHQVAALDFNVFNIALGRRARARRKLLMILRAVPWINAGSLSDSRNWPSRTAFKTQ